MTLEESRLIEVYDSSDAAELGSAEARVKEYDLKAENASERTTSLERRHTKFRGATALYVHFRKIVRERLCRILNRTVAMNACIEFLNTRLPKLRSWFSAKRQRGLGQRSMSSCSARPLNSIAEIMSSIFESEMG